MELDCPICLESYDEEVHAPVRLFCCQKTLCSNCLEQIASNTSACPWDKKRWVQRSVLKKCLQNTPANYLEHIKSICSSQDNSEFDLISSARPLGDGLLKAEYETQVRLLHAEHSAQIERDDRLALELLQEEEAQLQKDREIREAMSQEDSRIAAELSLRSPLAPPPSREGKAPTKNKRSSTGSIRNGHRSITKVGDNCQQKNGILNYFNAAVDRTERTSSNGNKIDTCIIINKDEEGRGKRSSQDHSRSVEEGIQRKRPLGAGSSAEDRSGGCSRAPKKVGLSLHRSSTSAVSSCDPSVVPVVDLASPSQIGLPYTVIAPSQSLTAASSTAAVDVQSWSCAICTFSNFGLLPECEMCGSSRKEPI